MKRALLILPVIFLFAACTHLSQAQIRFNKIYNIVSYEGEVSFLSFENLYVQNDGYFLIGMIPDTMSLCCVLPVALIVDSDGNITQWQSQWPFPKHQERYPFSKSLIKIDKHYYTLMRYSDRDNGLKFPVVAVYDSIGTLTNTYYLNDTLYSFFSGVANLCRLNNNSLLASASGTTATNSRQSIYTYAIDSNGIIMQINIYATVGFGESYPKAIYKNQKEIILFSSVSKQVPTTYSGFVSRIIARRLDTLGNFLGYSYQGSFADSLYGVQDVIATRDGGYLIATQRYTYSLSQNFQFTNGAFLKLSSSGVKQWMYFPGHYQLGADSSSAIVNSNNAIELPSGDLMISGTYHQFKENGDTITPAELRPPVYFWFLSKLSSNGELKWNRLYNYIKPNNLRMYGLNNYDLDTCPDKGFILSGFLTDNVNGLSSGWLVKVDSMGCLVPGCYLPEPQNPTDSTVQVLLYPNPADQFINFVAKFFKGEVHYKLIDIQGRIIAEGITANDVTNMMDVRFLSSALYILQVYDEHTRITKKVMVVH